MIPHENIKKRTNTQKSKYTIAPDNSTFLFNRNLYFLLDSYFLSYYKYRYKHVFRNVIHSKIKLI